MLDDFMVRAGLAGVGVALAAGPLGSFVVWRRMAYFGDAMAHASILGVTVALALSISVVAGVLAVALGVAAILIAAEGRGQGMDTLLGVLSHAGLALGLVALSFLPDARIDLMGFLFGDILAVTRGDLAVIYLGAGLILAALWLRWSALLTTTLTPDLAASAGLNPRRQSAALTIMLAVVVAVSIKVLGALLIGAMLIVPAAAARPLSRTPEQMALVASGIGVVSVVAGLAASLRYDTPAGPSIVSTAVAVFVVTSAIGGLRR